MNMGFMDKLKEIGLGNTGPRGNMNSGATNYSNYAKDRAALESERQAAQVRTGVAQALALEAKNGKMISWNKFADIAEKWGVPVQEVSTPGKDINDGLKTQMIKNQTHEAMQKYASKKKEDPSWAPTEEDIKNEAITQQWLPETMAILTDYIVQAQKPTAVPDTSRLVSLDKNNKVDVLLDSKEKQGDQWVPLPEKKIGTKTILRQRNKKTGEIKRTVVDESSGGNDKPTDFDKAYSQWIKIPGNENVTRAAFKTGPNTTPSGELTDNAALEILQNHALTIQGDPVLIYPKFVKEYNDYRKNKMSRAGAMEKVISQDRSAEADIPYPAAQHKGKVITDKESGKEYKSDGITWIEIK